MLIQKPNLVVIVSDTLRTAHLGCYGNPRIRTPNIDAFAGRAVRFTRAYPESLPTIPVRRALHTGRRAYPFRDYRPVKWDIVYLPGWQAMDNAEDTLAENARLAIERAPIVRHGCSWNERLRFSSRWKPRRR